MLGTVLATFGHGAIAEGPVPWRLVGTLAVAQFAAVWPLARRRYAPVATIIVTLAAQGVLHLALSYADDESPLSMPEHTHAGHPMTAARDGHAWHHAGAAMAAVHILTSLTVAWLLHRADARTTAALGTLRTLAMAAATALAHVLPRPVADMDRVMLGMPDGRARAWFGLAELARDEVLEHAVVRRGPPRQENSPVLHRSQHLRGRIHPYLQGVPLCPSPPTCRRVPATASLSPVPPH
ncbi:hypothetical protein ABZ471_43985 [Streptomyces sp. NPDC005728]|uniref:hypothetical protein n=1 Tax=Streptomyces sp. NPDC005728 TaxID=3157054 RepID=UPI0033C853A2